MKRIILSAIALLIVWAEIVAPQPTSTTSFPPLSPGCSADNVVRAIRAHLPDALSYCQTFAPSTSTRLVPQSTYGPITSTSAIATVTSRFPERYTQFTNVYSGNYIYSDRPSQSPLTYTNNKPSIWTVQNAFPTPSYLTSYDFWRIYSACGCVATPTSTVTQTLNYLISTVYVKPTSTYTYYEPSTRVSYPMPTYGALCDPSVWINWPGLLRQTASATRAVRTVSPLPTVRWRADCCQLCADTFNCLWWKHSKSGACEYVWATDINANKSEYDKCPNGFGGVNFGPVADKEMPDSFGQGTCSLPDQAYGEDQSSQGSTEETFHFQDNCAVFGGSYCA